jgi:hypothetical protein
MKLGTASAEQRTILNRLVYGPNRELEVVRDGKLTEEPDFRLPFAGFMETGLDLADEPTEALPTGLPPEGVLSLDLSKDFYAVPILASGQVAAMLRNLGTEELALLQMMSNMSEAPELAAQMPRIDNVKVGNRTAIRLRVLLGPMHRISARLSDDQPIGNAATVSMKALPADMQAKLAARTEALKKSPFGAMGSMLGGMGRQAVPPPR